MNKKIPVKDWIKALRSDKYKQGIGKLRSINDEFCCLGVLCDLIDPTGWKKRISEEEYFFEVKEDNTGLSSKSMYVLPNPIILPYPLDMDHLTSMNDAPRSFDKIANHIERNSNPDDVISVGVLK